MGLQNEIGNQWSSRQIQRNLCGKSLWSLKQVQGLDYFDTFAFTCKPETFRILLQQAAKQGHAMHQFDVKTAFLHSPIEEEVYLEQPQEFVKRGSDGKKLVCRLNKSIYGLKQVADNWYRELANFLLRQGFKRSRNVYSLIARAEKEVHTFILVWVDDIIVASRGMTVICDFKIGTRENISRGRQSEITLVFGSNNQTRRRQSHSLPWTLHRSNAWAISDGSMQTLNDSSWFEFEISDSTEGRRRSGPRYLPKLGWITSVTSQTDEARHNVHSLHSVQTHESTYQSTLTMRKTTSVISSRFKRFKYYLHKRSKLWFSGGQWCRLICWCEWQKINDGPLLQAYWTWRSTLLGCQEGDHSCFFFIGSCISGSGSSSSRSIVSETTSEGFRHPVETSNSNWRGQPELNQFVPKPSHAQEEQTHWEMISLHSRQDERWDYFNSLRSNWQKGSRHLYEFVTRIVKVETFNTVLMGTHSTQSAQVWVGVLEYWSNYNLEFSEN